MIKTNVAYFTRELGDWVTHARPTRSFICQMVPGSHCHDLTRSLLIARPYISASVRAITKPIRLHAIAHALISWHWSLRAPVHVRWNKIKLIKLNQLQKNNLIFFIAASQDMRTPAMKYNFSASL